MRYAAPAVRLLGKLYQRSSHQDALDNVFGRTYSSKTRQLKGGSSVADVDYFLKIDGAEGESPDSKHPGEIECLNWSWGEANAGSSHSGGGGGTGKVSMQDFHFTQRVCKSSPALMLFCADGTHIKKAVLTCRKAGKDQQEYLKIEMEDVVVSSFQTGGSQGSVLPTD